MDMENKTCRRITVADMAPHVHSFMPNENKVEKIVAWLKDWITLSLECGKIHPYDLLPLKADLACHIGVSQGTLQTAYRLLEDAGIVESKQRIGTYIKVKEEIKLEKLTSKREVAVEILKKYLLENNYKKDDVLPSTRSLAERIGISITTLQMAINNLVFSGFLKKVDNRFIVLNDGFEIENIQIMTLVEKIAHKLRKYIMENFVSGDRLPANSDLIKIFNVSAKTMHDAIRLLVKEGLLYSRRGQYGTIVLDTLTESFSQEQYFYEKIEQKIRLYISENCQINDKLPSIKKFAQIYETSEKTVKKALDNLAEEGYLAFSRGRYGGTFVLDIPQASGEAYKWLAISTDYMTN